MKIINRRNVLIAVTLTATGTFTFTLSNLQFQPDTVVIRQIAYKNSGGVAENGVSHIVSDMVNNNTLGALLDGASGHGEVTYRLKSFQDGTIYNFAVRKADGTLDTARSGNLFIIMEFIEHQNDK